MCVRFLIMIKTEKGINDQFCVKFGVYWNEKFNNKKPFNLFSCVTQAIPPKNIVSYKMELKDRPKAQSLHTSNLHFINQFFM